MVRRLGDLDAWKLGGLRWLGALGALGIRLGCSGNALTMLQGSLGVILVHLGMLFGSL